MINYADLIQKRIKELGLYSQAEAARECGLNPQTFNNAARGRRIIPAHQKILDAWLAKPVPPDAGSATKGNA